MADSKELTFADVAAHTGKKDLYLVVHDKVYNASSFVDEHPCVVCSRYTILPSSPTMRAQAAKKRAAVLRNACDLACDNRDPLC